MVFAVRRSVHSRSPQWSDYRNFPSSQLATVASSLFYAVWSLYTGFLITKPNIPGWWIWFYYLCPGAVILLPMNAVISCFV